jgi:protein-S-isoprenylcysteine O-methyltransferase Ste14
MSDVPDRARIIAPPPLLALVCIIAGFIAEHFKRLPLFTGHRPVEITLGVALFILAVALVFVAIRQFIAHGTHPSPYRPVQALVVDGIYKFGRNPIYLAFLLVMGAFAFWTNSIWFLLATGVAFVLLHFGVVKREEQYLSRKFPEAYDDYRRRVRRWI